MHCTPVKTKKSRKRHVCMSCGEAIEKGEVYRSWACMDMGTVSTNKMHVECHQMHLAENAGHEWEYTPYEYDRPGKGDE